MKPISNSLPIALLALTLTAGWASAAPRVPNVDLAEQVANVPSDQTDQDTANGPKQSPSEKLSQHKGVIRPPPTGDHAVIQPPATGKTNKAVIPPPGTPGGDQSVQPK